MTIAELEKKFSDLTTNVDTMKKDFELKLDAQKKETDSWKTVAENKQKELLSFQETAEKAQKDRDKAYAEARATEIKNFVADLKKSGRLTPAIEEMVLKLMESMTIDTTVISFSQKDGKTVSHSQLSLFKEIFSALPAGNHLRSFSKVGEVSPTLPSQVRTTGSDSAEYTEIHRGGEIVRVPVDDGDLHAKALKFIEDQKGLGRVFSYGDALIEVSKAEKREMHG